MLDGKRADGVARNASRVGRAIWRRCMGVSAFMVLKDARDGVPNFYTASLACDSPDR